MACYLHCQCSVRALVFYVIKCNNPDFILEKRELCKNVSEMSWIVPFLIIDAIPLFSSLYVMGNIRMKGYYGNILLMPLYLPHGRNEDITLSCPAHMLGFKQVSKTYQALVWLQHFVSPSVFQPLPWTLFSELSTVSVGLLPRNVHPGECPFFPTS